MSSFAGLFSPSTAEAKSIFFGLLMAFEGGITNLTLNSDATSIIDLIRSFNGKVVFSFSPRSTNRVTHSIVKLALVNFCNMFWVDDCHPNVRNLILEDSSSILYSFFGCLMNSFFLKKKTKVMNNLYI
ncbi:hypothetical protein ACOSQ4_027918 [Xanthoceras sorbifolium]